MRTLTMLALSLTVLAVGTAGARAAPQILAVLQQPGPVPVTCTDGACRVELATLCLQRHRDVPEPGKRYTPATAGTLVLTGRDAAGNRVSRPLGAEARIAALRGYTTVAVGFDAGRVAGLTEVAVVVAPGAALIPEPEAGDADPLTAKEIAYFTGSMRRLATEVFSAEAHRRDAALVLGRLIDATPVTGAMTAESRDGIWRRAMDAHPADWSPVGRDHARTIHDACRSLTDRTGFYLLRSCLEHRQEELLMNLNGQYWRAAEPGS